MSDKFVIQGGKSPKGEIEVKGAKNAALPILAAALLTSEPCIIKNVPLIEDIFRMIKTMEELGAKISWTDEKELRVDCSEISASRIPKEIVNRFRGSILIAGPLLARFSKIKMPSPGGCLIGARPIDTHLDAFSQIGAQISAKDGVYNFQIDTVKDVSEVVLNEFSVTATENILLFASLNPKKTVIKIADQDYEVQELAKVLKKMGVKVIGIGTHTITVIGAKKLKGFECSIISDPIETGTFMALSLATKGEIIIKKAEFSYLTLFLKRLKDFGAQYELLSPDKIKVLPSKNIRIDKIQSLPYPGIHSDLLPELGVLSTQTKGPTLIHDPLYEGRLKYLEELNKMGADIIFCDPHRAIINGPTALHGIEIPSPDLRAGAALIIAGLIAKGRTVIENIYQIDRGYEKIEERLKPLGLDIQRV